MLVEANWKRESCTTSTHTTSLRTPGSGRRRAAHARAPGVRALRVARDRSGGTPNGSPGSRTEQPFPPWSAARPPPPPPPPPDLHRDLDGRPVEPEASAKFALQKPPVAGLEEPGGEDD